MLAESTLSAAPATVSLKWSEIGPVASGRRANVQLRDRTSVEVMVRAVEPGALSAIVSDDRHPRYKRGQAAIPRGEIVAVEVHRRGKRRRVIGTTLGTAAGVFGGGGLAVAAVNHDSSALAWLALAVLAAGPAVGYALGSRSDGKDIIIIVLPD